MDAEETNFEPCDPKTSPEALTLQECRSQLTYILNVLRFEVDLRKITPGFIDDLEETLRGITKEVCRLEYTPRISALLKSTDAVQRSIEKAIDNLYVVSGILHKKTTTISEQEMRFKKLRACQKSLLEALEYFLV